MQFAFTEEQELLRREAREALSNGGWSREELAEADMSFLDRAVLYEEAGGPTSVESLFDEAAPREEQLADARRSRRSASARRRSSSRSSTRRTASSSAGRSACTRRSSHPLADTFVETELARSLAYWAAWCVAEQDEQLPVAVAAAKSYCADAAVAACERSIQVHGGIGFTWEHVLHEYYKRALAIQAFGGYSRVHRAVVADHLLG